MRGRSRRLRRWSVFEELLGDPAGDPKEIAQKKGLIQVRDVGATERWVDEALAANPKAVEDFKNNPKKKQASLGFCVRRRS